MKKLHLNLKRKWFDMILSGEKKEEYREIKGYWANKLLISYPDRKKLNSKLWNNILRSDKDNYKWLTKNFKDVWYPINFDSITFSNGYSKDRDQFEIELLGIEIKEGNPEWGAEKGVKYFVLKLGKLTCSTT